MKDEIKDKKKKKSPVKQDPEMMYTTDPQENMEGVLSTIVQKVKESSNPSNNESKEEATKRKDENT